MVSPSEVILKCLFLFTHLLFHALTQYKVLLTYDTRVNQTSPVIRAPHSSGRTNKLPNDIPGRGKRSFMNFLLKLFYESRSWFMQLALWFCFAFTYCLNKTKRFVNMDLLLCPMNDTTVLIKH